MSTLASEAKQIDRAFSGAGVSHALLFCSTAFGVRLAKEFTQQVLERFFNSRSILDLRAGSFSCQIPQPRQVTNWASNHRLELPYDEAGRMIRKRIWGA